MNWWDYPPLAEFWMDDFKCDGESISIVLDPFSPFLHYFTLQFNILSL